LSVLATVGKVTQILRITQIIYYRRNMTQDERWMAKYNEVVEFIETNHRNPSRHRIEEHDLLNWLKVNRKRMNANELKPERVGKFKDLLALMEEHKHVNQWK